MPYPYDPQYASTAMTPVIDYLRRDESSGQRTSIGLLPYVGWSDKVMPNQVIGWMPWTNGYCRDGEGNVLGLRADGGGQLEPPSWWEKNWPLVMAGGIALLLLTGVFAGGAAVGARRERAKAAPRTTAGGGAKSKKGAA